MFWVVMLVVRFGAHDELKAGSAGAGVESSSVRASAESVSATHDPGQATVPSGHEGHQAATALGASHEQPTFPLVPSDLPRPGGSPQALIPELAGLGNLTPATHGAVKLPGMPAPPDPVGDTTHSLPGRHP